MIATASSVQVVALHLPSELVLALEQAREREWRRL